MKRILLGAVAALAPCIPSYAQVSFGLSSDTPSTLCVYDRSATRPCVPMGTVDNTGHLFASTPAALDVAGAVTGAGFTALFASPPAIGSTAPGTGAFTTLSASGAVTGAGFAARFACDGASDKGFVGDGVTDNLAAWNAWVGSIGTADACLEFKAGLSYRFTAAVTASLAANQDLVLVGHATVLDWPASHGLTLTYASGLTGYASPTVDIGGFIFTTGGAGLYDAVTIDGKSAALNFIGRQTSLHNNTFMGDDGGTTHYWRRTRSLTDLSNVNMFGNTVYGHTGDVTAGVGIWITGTAEAATPSAFNIAQENVWYSLRGVELSGYWQGLNVTQSNFTAVTEGVRCAATIQEYQCSVTNSQFSVGKHAIVANNILNLIATGNSYAGGYWPGTVAGDGIVQATNTSNSVIGQSTFDGSSTGSGVAPNAVTLAATDTNITISDLYIAGVANNIAGNNATGVTAVNVRAAGATAINLAAPYVVANYDGMRRNAAGFDAFVSDASGHTNFGPTPTIGACGTASVAGKDGGGSVTISVPPAETCTVNFGAAWGTAPYCTVTSLGNQVLYISAISTTALTVSVSPTGAPVSFNFMCLGA